MTKTSETDTERIVRAVDQIQRGQTRPGSHEDCPHTKRIDAMENKLERHEDRFNEGEKQFMRLENGLTNVANNVGTLNKILVVVGGTIGLGLLGTAGTALVWVMGQMGKGTP